MASMQVSLNPLSQLLNTRFENENLLELQINKIKNLYSNDLNIDLSLDEDLNENENESFYEVFFNDLCIKYPDIEILKSSISTKRYKRLVSKLIWIFISCLPFIYSYYVELNTDIHYKTNSKPFVRSSPTTENKSNIIKELGKNVYVKKIGTNDKGWVNVRFELKDGVQEEGWIYRTKLTKIDD